MSPDRVDGVDSFPFDMDAQWFFTSVLGALREVFLLLDEHGRIRFAGGAVLSMLGVRGADLQGRLATDFVQSPHDLDDMELADQTTDSLTLRVSVRRPDGSETTATLTSSTLRPVKNHPIRTIMLLHDITDEMQTQVALEARNRQLATLGRVSALVAVGGDLEALLEKLVLISMQNLRLRAAAVFLLHRDEHLAKLAVHRGVPREIIVRLAEYSYDTAWLQRAASEPGPLRMDNLQFLPPDIHADLQRHRLQGAEAVLLVNKGQAVGIFFYMPLSPLKFEDLALLEAIAGQMALAIEKNRLMQDLRESERKYSMLVESANDGIMISQDGVFQFVNKKLADMLDYKVSDLLGLPIQAIMYPEDIELFMGAYNRRITGELTKEIYQGRLMAKDGHPVRTELNAVTFAYRGRPASLSFVRDLRLRIQLQQALVAEKDAAEFFNDVLTHDVNNLIHTIIGNLDLQGDPMVGSLDEAHDAYRQKALANAKRGSALIDRVRELMMIRRLDPDTFVPLPLRQLLDEAADTVREQFADEKYVFSVDVEPHQHVLGHPLAAQIFVNLFSNALRHNSSEFKEVRVSVAESEDRRHWTVILEDNGDGIPQELQDRIFARYTRFSKQKHGLGLGMSIVKAAIGALEGEIRVESRVPDDAAAGTRFYVSLPKG
ncbi:MAG: PAS domain S-box protein [Candidatus Lernaella stagnicola]|nr:PAS domain S-box protein [Candidatus Lernaella stagnicola]